MPRIVLLGLGNEDVDVLTVLARMDPRPEVLAVHPDPEALLLRLAAVASYPALTEPPRPRPDDVAVIAARPQRGLAELVRPWREAGARVVSVKDPDLAQALAGEAEEPGEAETVADQAVGTGSGTVLASKEHEGTEPTTAAPMHSGDGHSGENPGGTADGTGENAGEDDRAERGSGEVSSGPAGPAPADVWDRPEATFRYLVEQGGGAESAVSLWWDGAMGIWVPWTWVGDVPEGGPEEPDRGLRIESEWGTFRVVAPPAVLDRLPAGAVRRVAEDMALRDLMRWQRREEELRALGVPSPEADGAALAGWGKRVLEALEVETGLFWRVEGDRFRLVGAWGTGVDLEGTLVLPSALLQETLEGPGSRWTPWEPVPGVRMHLRGLEDDPRRRLRLRRVERALAGEDAAR